jgi:hypothetical protein
LAAIMFCSTGTSVAAATQAAANAAPMSPATVQGDGGIVYGEHHSFSIESPPGWTLDNQSGASQGLHAVLYRVGLDYKTAPVIMYANGNDRRGNSIESLEEFIANDTAGYRSESPSLSVSKLPPITLEDGRSATVIGFRGDRWGNVEAVAYIPEKASINMLVLSARTEHDFNAAYEDFSHFVHSYHNLDLKVQIQPR